MMAVMVALKEMPKFERMAAIGMVVRTEEAGMTKAVVRPELVVISDIVLRTMRAEVSFPLSETALLGSMAATSRIYWGHLN